MLACAPAFNDPPMFTKFGLARFIDKNSWVYFHFEFYAVIETLDIQAFTISCVHYHKPKL